MLGTTTAQRRPERRMVAAVAGFFANGEDGIWIDPSSILFQDASGTMVVTTPAQSVGRGPDVSGNGLNATQATVLSQPTYGIVPKTGRRNLAIHTSWTDAVGGSPGTAPTGWAIAFGSGAQTSLVGSLDERGAQAIRFDAGNGERIFYSQTVNVEAGNTYSLSAEVTGVSGEGGTVLIIASGSATGVSTNVVNPTETGRATATYACSGSGTVTLRFGLGATSTIGGDAHIIFKQPQLEIGLATAYQSVKSQYEVTEAGVLSRYYIADDGGDSLNATLPNLGTDATVAYASDQGITILTGQTIGAGAFDVLRDSQLFGMIVVDRALTALETSHVTKYLESKGLAL